MELYSLGHCKSFFYMEHAMGLASSLGLGLALCLPKQRIVVVDGDGSVLMNLGTLSTMARYRPPNLVHLIFDNESLLSVGGFPTATSTGTDLEAVAKGAGIERTATVREVEELEGLFIVVEPTEWTTTVVAATSGIQASSPTPGTTPPTQFDESAQEVPSPAPFHTMSVPPHTTMGKD